MAYARKEFEDDLRERRKAAALSNRRQLQQIAQAEVPIDSLTHSKEWDYFLSILQEQIEKLEQVRMLLQDSADADGSFAYEDLARLKAQKMQIAIQIDTLRRVRDLPAQILAQGEKAKLVLKTYADE